MEILFFYFPEYSRKSTEVVGNNRVINYGSEAGFWYES